ncbi:hypothetical protein L484_023117 [Morus notabilis]|uniref:Uncharacterized protein n=1 Tax=Morus notabilis TaxID=981085 RepID=W9RX59_9ROSA|nr:hypothetical protein L484_023117 [Morus notabilis]
MRERERDLFDRNRGNRRWRYFQFLGSETLPPNSSEIKDENFTGFLDESSEFEPEELLYEIGL